MLKYSVICVFTNDANLYSSQQYTCTEQSEIKRIVCAGYNWEKSDG